MKRARARELTLVNWKGVFYERYLLDSNVTALEGDNGAGKTTVMIAAYVVLFPDLSRLRFTNVGETGATGGDKGIWGRLGQLARPSYCAMTLRIGDGRELIAGVIITRKAEPSLELQPFLISDLPPEARARDYLLRVAEEHDEIPTVDEVKQAVADSGAKLELFATSKAYFATLFELGISPMRLSSDEERNKYNDMLRTSMTGGISRTLTSELRSFVFKRETGLSDTLTRMRGNLSACRKTRLEVVESRQLERHISGIYDAGLSMFEAAFFATQLGASETARERSRAKALVDEAETVLVEQGLELSEAGSRSSSIGQRLDTARQAAARAKERVECYKRSLQAVARVSKLEHELADAQGQVRQVELRYDEAAAHRAGCRQRWSEVQSALSRSAVGLANLQTGLEELHRRAHAYRKVVAEIATARESLLTAGFEEARLQPLQNLSNTRSERDTLAEYLSGLRREAQALLGEADGERARRARLTDTAGSQRQEHEQALAALRLIAGDQEVTPPLLDAARSRLTALAELDKTASTVASVRAELSSLEARHERQCGARERASALNLPQDIASKALHQQISQLDAEVREAREQARDANWQVRQLAERRARLEGELAQVTGRRQRYEELAECYRKLRAADVNVDHEGEHWDDSAEELERRLGALEQRVASLASERQDALNQAARFEAIEEAPSEELSRLRDALCGEFLSRRFEDLEPEEARYVEASLGPLRDAIVVEDLEQAKQALAEESRSLPDVWLVSASAEFSASLRHEALADKDLVVTTEGGVRVSRLPEFASLGRVARQRRAESLRKLAASRSSTLEQEERELRRLRELHRELRALARDRALWLEGDPRARAAELERVLSETVAAEERERLRARQVTQRADEASNRVESLRPLLVDAALLDEPELPLRVEACRQRLEVALSAKSELERVREARETLRGLLDALRVVPPDDATLQGWRSDQAALDAKRDSLFRGIESLETCAQSIHALEFEQASAALERQSSLVPELEQQHQGLEASVTEAEATYAESEVHWESAAQALQQANAHHGALSAHLERARVELTETGIDAPDAVALEQLEADAASAQLLVSELEAESSELLARTALATERRTTATERRDEAIGRVVRIEQRFEPAQRAWQTLQRAVGSAKLQLPTNRSTEGETSDRMWAMARSRRQLLADRLVATGEASELLPQLENGARDEAQTYLELWQAVRQWLHRRLPAQVADVAEPLEALARLRDDLTTLESRLRLQETELRGASEDVARSIEAQVRRATRQIRRINQYLEGIRFGSISGIRIKLGRVDKMTQVLSALRDGSAQKLLFQAHLPFEEALDEIFLRYGGGRSGGHRLLDYREYIDLQVEVQRRGDESPWEPANPTRVSTGEAIGVGAALMMVILTEWERDANLLRGSKSFGSLRFLFLDEANRLSQDNLGVLFELCQTLELQLLIAAPEVARAEGNTTYRLVRRVAEDGTEEVLVSGRRARLPNEESSPPTEGVLVDAGTTGDSEQLARRDEESLESEPAGEAQARLDL